MGGYQSLDNHLGCNRIIWVIKNNGLWLANLYKTGNATLEAIRSPPNLTNSKTSPSHLKIHVGTVKDQDVGKQNCPVLKKKKKHRSRNYFRHLMIGKYTPKLLDTFCVPLRYRFSALPSLGPDSYLFEIQTLGKWFSSEGRKGVTWDFGKWLAIWADKLIPTARNTIWT